MTWWALIGGVVALLLALVLRRQPLPERWGLGTLAVALFSRADRDPRDLALEPAQKSDPFALSPRLVHNLRTKVPKGAIVIAPLSTSYRVAAAAPVYIVAAP